MYYEQIKIYYDGISPFLERSIKGTKAKLIKTYFYNCNDFSCNISVGRKLLYRDYNHLGISGSEYFGRQISKFLKK